MSKTISLIKGEVRIYVTDATSVAQKAMEIHNTLPLASLALSTAITAFGTFGIMKKDINTSVNVKGNGPLKNIIVETDGTGNIRALVGNPFVATDADKENFNDIPLTVGIGDGGTLKIVHSNEKINFGGEVPLANGDITTDLAYYLDQSEQIYSAVISSVLLNTQNKLKHAKSVIFQMLPKHNELDVRWVEGFIKNNKLSDLSIDDYVKKIEGKILETTEMKWKCSCSKEKMYKATTALSEKEKLELKEKYGSVEVLCNFCNKKYKF